MVASHVEPTPETDDLSRDGLDSILVYKDMLSGRLIKGVTIRRKEREGGREREREREREVERGKEREGEGRERERERERERKKERGRWP